MISFTGLSFVGPRLSKQISIHVNTLQKLYKSLETLQAEVAVTRSERPAIVINVIGIDL